MRRKALFATLLLPLPFAALPLVGVLLGMTGNSQTVIVDTRQPVARQMQLDIPKAQSDPLAYGVSDQSPNGCAIPSELSRES